MHFSTGNVANFETEIIIQISHFVARENRTPSVHIMQVPGSIGAVPQNPELLAELSLVLVMTNHVLLKDQNILLHIP